MIVLFRTFHDLEIVVFVVGLVSEWLNRSLCTDSYNIDRYIYSIHSIQRTIQSVYLNVQSWFYEAMIHVFKSLLIRITINPNHSYTANLTPYSNTCSLRSFDSSNWDWWLAERNQLTVLRINKTAGVRSEELPSVSWPEVIIWRSIFSRDTSL